MWSVLGAAIRPTVIEFARSGADGRANDRNLCIRWPNRETCERVTGILFIFHANFVGEKKVVVSAHAGCATPP